jgi:membrane associated rhomboid family serine protease
MRPPQDWKSARVTLVIAAVTALCWLAVRLSGHELDAIAAGGFLPARLDRLAGFDLFTAIMVTPLTAALLHSGLIHLGVNLFFLLLCGRSIEPILSGRGLAVLYVAGAYAAAAAHYAFNPHGTEPMIGASGGVWAAVGAWAMLFGKNRVRLGNPTLARWVHLLWLAAAWIALQLLVEIALYPIGAQPGIAFHVGGFVAGLLLSKPLLMLRWRGA